MIRAMATANITWGLVSIPIKLYLATDNDAGVHFNQLTSGESPVRVQQKLWDPANDVEVKKEDVQKGYEYARGQYVIFSKEELAALESTTNKIVDVKEFVPESAIDALLVDQTYYLGVDKGGDKGYTLLSETLRERGVVAVAQWSNRGKEHLVSIAAYGSGLVMRLLHYADEVRDQAEVTDMVAKVFISDAERDMGRQLVDQLTRSTFDPSPYFDTFAKRVREAAEQKAAGSAVVVPVTAPKATIVDLFDALKRSVHAVRGAEPAPAPAAAGVAPATKKAKGKASSKRRSA